MLILNPEHFLAKFAGFGERLGSWLRWTISSDFEDGRSPDFWDFYDSEKLSFFGTSINFGWISGFSEV